MVTATSETQAKIVATLYQCRDQAVFLRGVDGFKVEVAKWKPLFDDLISTQSCSVIEALIILLGKAKGADNEGMLMHVLSAVGCELAEPKYTA